MKQVIIVGGGVIGLFSAVRLAKAGARVTLLEAEAEHAGMYGPAASAAAAGMLAPLNEESSPHDPLALQSYELWQTMRTGAEWADGVCFDGGVVAARDADEAAAFAQNVARLGRAASVLSPAQARKKTGFEAKLEHALFLEDEGVADPMRVLSGLAMQARAHGVIIEYHQDVAEVTATTATTHAGRVLEGDVVMLSPGAWATQKIQAAAPALRHIRPAKGHLVSVHLERPLGPNFRSGGFYLAQHRDEAVLGATVEFDRFDRKVSEARVNELLAEAERVLPGEVRPVGRAWAGIRPMTADGWPMIGWSGGVLVAAGHSRNGWLLAPITAEIITAYVFGAEIQPAWAALSPDRFGSP